MPQTAMPLNIRSFVPNDYESIKSLIQCFAELNDCEFNANIFNQCMQARLLDNSAGTFIAESEGEIIGSSFADLEHDPRGVLRGRMPYIFVKQGYEGNGCGSTLIDKTSQSLQLFNVASIWANVKPDDLVLMHIFEKRDFYPVFISMAKKSDPKESQLQSFFTQSEIKFRTGIPQDIPSIKALVQELASFLDEPFDPFWFDLNVQNYFRGSNSGILIAETGGRILGITFAESKRDIIGLHYGYISNIIVNPDTQGMGIGYHLLQIATTFLTRLRVSFILGNVNYGNKIMQKIYEKLGFQQKYTIMNKPANLDAGC